MLNAKLAAIDQNGTNVPHVLHIMHAAHPGLKLLLIICGAGIIPSFPFVQCKSLQALLRDSEEYTCLQSTY